MPMEKSLQFILSLKLDNYLFNFSNETHQFISYAYSDTSQNLSMHFKQFILFNGTHQLPSTVIFRIGEEQVFLITFKELSHFNVTNKFFNKKVSSSQSLLKKASTQTYEFMYR